MLDWPFVCRAREFQRALDVFEKRFAYQGVVLVGEAGVGKTALAHALADALKSTGLKERFILGTTTGRAVPLAAFQRWVPVAEPHEPAVLIRREIDTTVVILTGSQPCPRFAARLSTHDARAAR